MIQIFLRGTIVYVVVDNQGTFRGVYEYREDANAAAERIEHGHVITEKIR